MRRPRGAAGAAGGDNADAFAVDAFRQLAQGLLRVQEALRLQHLEAERRAQDTFRLQEQEAERKIQEAMRLQELRAATAMQEAMSQLEQKRDEAIRRLQQSVEDRMQRMEERLGLVVDQLNARDKNDREVASEGQVLINQLDNRLMNMEAIVRRVVERLLPETSVLSSGPHALNSTSVSSTPPFSSASTLPSTSTANTTQPLLAAAPREAGADDQQRERRRVEQQVQEVKARMLRAGAAPSPLGVQLCLASHEGRLQDVLRLLNNGTDANYVSATGDTPLISAFYLGSNWTKSKCHPNVVSLLLRRGAEVNAVNEFGAAALHYAAFRDSTGRCVELLLDAGANVDARDIQGESPLHWAALRNNEVAVRALLAAGARKTVRIWSDDKKDKTPLDVATSEAIRDLLRP